LKKKKKKMNGALMGGGLFTANGSLMVAVRVVGWDERTLKMTTKYQS
jgi:hypothetical protein